MWGPVYTYLLRHRLRQIYIVWMVPIVSVKGFVYYPGMKPVVFFWELILFKFAQSQNNITQG